MAQETMELKTLTSLKDLALEGIAREVGDLTEDAWSFGAPPPRDIYQLKFFLAKDGWKQGLEDAKDPASIYLQANLECRIVSENEDYDNIPVFFRVSTRIYRGHTISTMDGLITKFGFAETLKKQGKVTPKKLAQFLEAALKKEPMLWSELDWKGSYQYTDNKGEETWVNYYNHMEDFPKLEDGTRQHIVTINGKDKQPHEIRAQLFVARLFGKGEEVPRPGTLGLVSAPKGPQIVSPVKVQEVTPVLDMPKPSEVKPTPQASTVSSEETDMELLLAE